MSRMMTHTSLPHRAVHCLAALTITTAVAATSFADDKTPVTIDGQFAEWPASAIALADGQHLYLHLSLADAFTLQGGTRTTRLRLDLDGKATTGKRDKPADEALGVDLEVVFSPPSPEAGKGLRSGVSVLAYDDRGLYTEVGHGPIQLTFAPSFAAREYELRIARTTSLAEPVGSRWHAAQRMRGELLVSDADGAAMQEPIRFGCDLPPRSAVEPAGAIIPPRAQDTMRMMSWNVEWEHPVQNPPPFARILRALQPDVILIQEWKSTPAALVAWFSANVPSETPWRAHTLDELGTCVISRHPLVALNTAPLLPERTVNDNQRPIRIASARIESPLGALIATSLHLKCCGAQGTWEDELRQVEASTVNNFLRGALVKDDAMLVISGDLNLVGTDLPVVRLRDDLDADGSDLDLVDARVIGDAANYTWTMDTGRFTPGRLDYAMFSDSRMELRQAFILDTAHLAEAALKQYGLQRGDSAATDHRPLVYDLARPVRTGKAPGPAGGSDDSLAR